VHLRSNDLLLEQALTLHRLYFFFSSIFSRLSIFFLRDKDQGAYREIPFAEIANKRAIPY
jgi:hypothetical protein